MSMKITPIVLLMSIAGLYGFVFPFKEKQPLLESLSDDSNEFTQVLVGACAIDALVEAAHSSSSSLALHVHDQWQSCLRCSFVDSSSYDQIVLALAAFIDSVKAAAASATISEAAVDMVEKWATVLQMQLERTLQSTEMLQGTRGRRKKKTSFWKPFLTGAALVGLAAAGYIWLRSKGGSSSFDALGLRARQVGSQLQHRVLGDMLGAAREADHHARVGAIAARDAARMAPFHALRQEGRQWIPRLAPELCTYLQENKGLVVHQVTQTKMLVDSPDRGLRSYIQYGHAHQNHPDAASVLRGWIDHDKSALLATEVAPVSPESMGQCVRQCVEQGDQFRILVSVWCGQLGGSHVVAAYKRMIRNEHRYIQVSPEGALQELAPLLHRHPEYYSLCSRFLVRACNVEIATYAQRAVHERVAVGDILFGRSLRDVQPADIQRYHLVGGMARNLDEWVCALRDTPALQDRAISLMYEEIIQGLCERFSCDEAAARLHFIGSLWQGRRTRQILRAVYNQEVVVGTISGSRLPAGTSLPLSPAHMMPGGEEGSSDDESDGLNNPELRRVTM
ncbi:MAG: hypothetical protein WCJ17_03020 [bacterium]